MSTSWLLNLPQGWEMAGKRPHGALEAVKRSGPTALHVVCGRTPESLWGASTPLTPASASEAGGTMRPGQPERSGTLPPPQITWPLGRSRASSASSSALPAEPTLKLAESGTLPPGPVRIGSCRALRTADDGFTLTRRGGAWEQAVHGVCATTDHWPQLFAVYNLGCVGRAVPH